MENAEAKSGGVGVVRRHRPVLGVVAALVAGLALRAWFVAHAPRISDDGLMYADIARNWLQHGIYGVTRGQTIRPTLIRLPGYPFFLGICFALFGPGNFRGVMMVHVAIDLGTCALAAATAGRLLGRRAGMAALWLAVLCPFTANYVATALTETLSIFCVALVFYALVRWSQDGSKMDRWLWLMGLAMAYATMLRPEQGLLTAAVTAAAAWAAWRGSNTRRSFIPVAVMALLAVLPLVPWTVRNWRTFHVLQPLAPRNANDPGEPVPVGFQRWFRTWGVDFISTDQVYWNYDNDAILPGDLPARALDSADQYRRTAALLGEYNQTTTATLSFNDRFAAIAEERIRGHRFRYYLALPLARLADMLFRPRTELLNVPLDWWRVRLHPAGSALAIAYLLIDAGYFAFAACGFWRRRARLTRMEAAMLLFCVLRCAMLATIDNSEPRYTLELFPVLIVWVAFFLVRTGEEPSGDRLSGSFPA